MTADGLTLTMRGGVVERDSTEDRAAAAGRAALLLDTDPAERLHRVAAEPRFQTPGLAERLTDDALTAAELRTGDAVAMAGLAVAVGETLSRERDGAESVVLARSRARAALANALRASRSFDEARVELDALERELTDETRAEPPPGALYELALQRSELLADLGHFERAGAVLDGLEDLREICDGRARVARAVLAGRCGQTAQALRLLEEVERSLDPTTTHRLLTRARHHGLWFLLDAGEVREALRLYDCSRSLYGAHLDPWFTIHRQWLEARLCWCAGRLDDATDTLSALWTFVFVQGRQHTLALVSLDLCAAYVARGKFAKGWQLCSRLIPLFQSWNIHRRVLEAWALLRHEMSSQQANGELIARLRDYVDRGWNNPDLPFQ